MRLALLLVVGTGCLGEEPAPAPLEPEAPAWVSVLELRLEPVLIEGGGRPP